MRNKDVIVDEYMSSYKKKRQLESENDIADCD
jgi:hypothetical protein